MVDSEEGIECKLEKGERVEQKEMRHDKKEETEVCLRIKDDRTQRKMKIQVSVTRLSSGIHF